MTTRELHERGLQNNTSSIEDHTSELAEAIVSTLREPLLVLSDAFVVHTANQAFYRTFHVRPDETVGRSLFELGNGQWNTGELRHLLEEVLPRQAHFTDFEVEHSFDHIGRRTMLLNARQLAPIDGMQEMILLAIEDVTDRVAWQEKEARLNQRVAQRTQELEWANRALDERNRELQDFAYIASHDLQEPLRKISAFAGVLDEDYADRLDEQGRYYLERVRDAAGRMSELIEGLLAFSRIAVSGANFERVDLGAVVAAVLSDLEFQIAERGAQIDVGTLPEIEAVPMQMRQLFQNLLTNALKYQPEDHTPHVRIRAEALEGSTPERWRIRVEDNGIGIEEKDLERIFGPFQRLHNRQEYRGTGMGLAICRRIVERHRGTIRAESTPGQGTTFAIELPAGQDV